MKRTILIYGLIAGAIVAGLMFATMPFWESGVITFDNGEFVGYTTMVISLSMVFFGIKTCRDNHFNGSISFWKAFKVGILISLIAAVMYALAWEISYHTININFLEKMSAHYLENMKTEGKTEAEIEAFVQQMEMYKEWYKNPFIRFGMTLAEILPVGIVITIISSLLLRNREVLPVN